MKIITAKDKDGSDLTPEQISKDYEKLLKAHYEAKRTEPTWSMFGGIISIKTEEGLHEYQVA